jgi:flagellar capping protein FliD
LRQVFREDKRVLDARVLAAENELAAFKVDIGPMNQRHDDMKKELARAVKRAKATKDDYIKREKVRFSQMQGMCSEIQRTFGEIQGTFGEIPTSSARR